MTLIFTPFKNSAIYSQNKPPDSAVPFGGAKINLGPAIHHRNYAKLHHVDWRGREPPKMGL